MQFGFGEGLDAEVERSAVDDQMIEGKLGNRDIQFDWASFAAQSLPDNVTADVWVDGVKQPDLPLTFAGIGDGERTATVLNEAAGRVAATLPGVESGVQPGALVVTSAGLVGEVSAISGRSAQIELVTARRGNHRDHWSVDGPIRSPRCC